MPFCSSCGASLDAGAKVCGKCGASLAASAPAAPAATAAPTPTKGGSGALKVILAILGIFVLFVVLIFAVVGYIGYRGYKAAKQAEAKMGQVTVDMPGGSGTGTASAGDATKMAQEMGIEVYPGAEAQKGGGAVSMGGFSVAGADFLTSDSPSQVADFYKKQYPKAMLVSQDTDHYSLMVNTAQGMATISIEPYEGKTKISIARMTGAKPPSGGQPN